MKILPALPRPRSVLVVVLAVTLPGLVLCAGLGFQQFRAHAKSPAAAPNLVRATSAFLLNNGGSVCFEFETADASPLWVLLQRPVVQAQRHPTVLVSNPVGESYQLVAAGSEREGELVGEISTLAADSSADARVVRNLRRLVEVIGNQDGGSTWDAADWYLY